MAKKFTVRGSGQFPLDMLRYDCCWPACSAPSDNLKNIVEDDYEGVRSVTLESERERTPTVDRWKSFGWRVLDWREEENDEIRRRLIDITEASRW